MKVNKRLIVFITTKEYMNLIIGIRLLGNQMTIRITDHTTRETYIAKSVEDCRDDLADIIGFRIVEAYGQAEVFANTVYELVEENHVITR